uniref:DOC domain-containing protein n=1 Tax=Bicosoecida sp. CB-2014 TaxID=1486930 RepID=A0A7S1GC50_9STRA|mmetsp:Transcript_6155/g.21856  ORF Transcript_6155/g.21856 Transcript_6155/m.21856 type:complete len:226 (+) Transcript_6155:93-770(+)
MADDGTPVSGATTGADSADGEVTPATGGGGGRGGVDAGEPPARIEIAAVEELITEGKRDVGREAVWTLSGAKPGNGVEQLVDDNPDTYWQSDGVQPHTITLTFSRKASLSEVALLLDFRHDESYTPHRLTVLAGTTAHDLRRVVRVRVVEPTGWVCVPLGEPDGVGVARYLRAHILQIAITNMHQNGRDTHVRQVKVFAPKVSTTEARFLPEFKSTELSMFSCIR